MHTTCKKQFEDDIRMEQIKKLVKTDVKTIYFTIFTIVNK